MGAHAYSVTNTIGAISAASFTWSNGATTNRAYLNDERMDRQMNIGASVASGINVIIDTGSATQLVGIAILNSNAAVQKSDAAVLVEASSNASFASDVNTAKAASTLYSTVLPRNKDHVLQWNANHSKRYWRLTWTWTGSVTNFKIGELWAFTSSTQLSRRSVYGSTDGKRMFTARDEFQTGEQRGVKLGGPQRVIELLFTDLTPTTRDQLDTMWSSAEANVGKFLWIDSYEAVATAAAAAEQNCVFGSLESNELTFKHADFDLHETSALVIRSAGREAGA